MANGKFRPDDPLENVSAVTKISTSSGATKRAVLLALCSVAAALALAWLMGRRLVNGPVRHIHNVLAARRSGNEEARTGMASSAGELEALGAEFDIYMDELNTRKAEREKAEEHRRILTAEMSHRLKNMIATTQAIARQTLRKETPPETLKAFLARLNGVAGAQQLLMADSTNATNIRDAIVTSVGLFENSCGERFDLVGPDIKLNSRATLSIAMAFHELCTNAVKYGALSNDQGKVDISWEVLDDDELRLVWTESGGPGLTPPEQAGFGTTMVQKLLSNDLQGEVMLEYLPSGLRFQLSAPLSAVLP